MPSLTRRRLLSGAGGIALAMPALNSARAATPISFRLDWTIYGSHAPFFLAKEAGLFDKAGLAVTIGEGQGSATVARLLGQGNDPLGFVDFGSMMFAVAAGIKLVALQRIISNNMCMVSHAEEAIHDPMGLEGKVVAYAPSESTAQMMPALLKINHVDPAKINVLTPATAAKNALFLQRRADAIPVSLNVQPAQLEAQGAKLERFMFSDFGVKLMNNGIVGNADWVHAHRDAAKSFLHCVTQAFEMAQQDPAKAIDAIIREKPEQARNKPVFSRQLDLTFLLLSTEATKGKPFGEMADADWSAMQTLLSEYGGLSKKTPLNELYTNSLLPG